MKKTLTFLILMTILTTLFSQSDGGHLETKESLAIFIGTVNSIKRKNFKEGEFDLITFKIDSIIKLDTKTEINDIRFLTKVRKKAVVMDDPLKHRFKIGIKYIVFLDFYNVDYYSSNQQLTKIYK
jgi:hypothetical protein